MSSHFGTLFKISTWGESHGPGVGVVVDGFPANFELSIEAIQDELDRRRPGQSKLTTPRKEEDTIEILSGVFEGKTLGTPIAMMVKNKDQDSSAYDDLKNVYRPSHADYTYDQKYGHRDHRGGGRSSARETVGRVAAGAIAQNYLKEIYDVDILSFVSTVHTTTADVNYSTLSQDKIDASLVRCPDTQATTHMIQAIESARDCGDSLGGVITGVLNNVPAGWGAPVFDKLKADLAKAMMSIPATMGFEVGAGFAATQLTGSQHNDAFISTEKGVQTATNHSGGMQGGISNGQQIVFRVAFKPTGTIFKSQHTVTKKGEPVELKARGRHDPCVLPRAVPIVDAMAALVLMDHGLRQKVYQPA